MSNALPSAVQGHHFTSTSDLRAHCTCNPEVLFNWATRVEEHTAVVEKRGFNAGYSQAFQDFKKS